MSWTLKPAPEILDPITEFRLSRPAELLPSGAETQYWSLLVELQDTSLATLEREAMLRFAADALIVPDHYTAEDRAAAPPSQIVTLFARAALVRALNTPGNAYGVVSLELGSLIPNDHLNSDLPPQDSAPEIRVSDDTVVTLVIDDSIAIAHELFQDVQGRSRIALAYVMDNNVGQDQRSHGFTLTAKKIDRLLADHTQNGLLDEAGFYRATGISEASQGARIAGRRSHGTHILSLAAGAFPTNAPTNRPILCAALPQAATEDVTGQSLAPSLACALEVLLRHAKRYRLHNGQPAPVSVNFSYGNYSGPHDGTALIPRLLENHFGAQRPSPQKRRLTLPASNGNLSRTHATIALPGKDPVALTLSVQPDDRSVTHLQLWMPFLEDHEDHDLVAVRVTQPGGPESPPIHARRGDGASLYDDRGREIARLAYHFRRKHTRRGVITLSLHPTATLNGNASALAPLGLWQISVTRTDLRADARIEAWIKRDETLPGFPALGRQSFFDNACYHRLDALGAPLPVDPAGSDCPVRRAGTLSGFATGRSPIVAAALTRFNGLLSDYSAAGPITAPHGHRDANRQGPDAAAPGDDSPVRLGVIGAGNRRGSFVRLNGTSVAAPLIARFVADELAHGHPADRAWVHRAACDQDCAYSTPKPAETRGGGGRLFGDALTWPFSPDIVQAAQVEE